MSRNANPALLKIMKRTVAQLEFRFRLLERDAGELVRNGLKDEERRTDTRPHTSAPV